MPLSPKLLFLPSLALAACQGTNYDTNRDGRVDGSMTFEEFRAGLYCEPGGACIIQGDIPIFGDEALREIFERNQARAGALTVMSLDELDVVWSPSQQHDLTYCVSADFGDRQEEVAQELSRAAAEWEEVANVRFRHLLAQDDRCTIRNNDVLFNVSPAPVGAPYFARAFFPNSPREEREILIEMDSMDASIAAGDLVGLHMQGVLRHELGHVLGFRHEHIRPQNATLSCFEDANFRPITEYDIRSTMHYPQCDGMGDWSLSLTDLDREGARFYYPDFDRYRGGRCTTELVGEEVNEACEPIVHEILELANKASHEVLDQWVGLDVRAVNEIVANRDATPYTTLAQLEAVGSLGPVTIRNMYDYLYVDGRCPVELDSHDRIDVRCRPVVHRVLELVNRASATVLDDDARLDSRAVRNILEKRADEQYTSLRTLWETKYVKTRAMRKLYVHLYGEPPPVSEPVDVCGGLTNDGECTEEGHVRFCDGTQIHTIECAPENACQMVNNFANCTTPSTGEEPAPSECGDLDANGVCTDEHNGTFCLDGKVQFFECPAPDSCGTNDQGFANCVSLL